MIIISLINFKKISSENNIYIPININLKKKIFIKSKVKTFIQFKIYCEQIDFINFKYKKKKRKFTSINSDGILFSCYIDDINKEIEWKSFY